MTHGGGGGVVRAGRENLHSPASNLILLPPQMGVPFDAKKINSTSATG